jgi:hypothetical protein
VTDTNLTEPPAAPRSIVVTWVALFVAAAFSVLSALALFGATSWLEEQQTTAINKKAITSSYTAEQKQKDLANVAHTVSQARPFQLVVGVVGALLLGFIAWRVREGRHWTRWTIVGAWILLSLTGYSLIGLSALFLQGTDAPALLKLCTSLGAVAFIVAVVAVNLPTSVRFLNANRPARPEGAGGTPVGLRGLFAPRGVAGRATPPEKPAKSSPGTVVGRPTQRSRPSATPPASAPPPAPASDGQRPKAKIRTTPSMGPGAKSRGKSRGR